MLTVTNLRPYGVEPRNGFDFEVNIAPHVSGLSLFVNHKGVVSHTLVDIGKGERVLTFSAHACHEIYSAIIEAAPDGMVLLPEKEAMKQVKGEG